MPNSQGVVQSNPMNFTHGKHTHNYSSFPDSLSYKNYLTLRFGDYTPTFVMDGVPRDEISLQAKHIIDSLSLNAPFKGSIRKITESFMVPDMAILPLNWDKIYPQPANGDDVPKDANCVLMNFPERIQSAFSYVYAAAYNSISGLIAGESSASDVVAALNSLLRCLVFGEYFFSAGSLPAVCGYHSNNFLEIFADNSFRTYDSWMNLVIKRVFSGITTFIIQEPVGSTSRARFFKGLAPIGYNQPHYELLRSYIELLRENPNSMISSISVVDSSPSGFVSLLQSMLEDFSSDSYLLPNPDSIPEALTSFLWRMPLAREVDSDDLTDMSQTNFNLKRILSYQLVCAHYYSNSAVDFIYSSELYREYIHSLSKVALGPNAVTTFAYNGMTCEYDYLSGYVLYYGLFRFFDLDWSLLDERTNYCMALVAAIFGFRKSLRFGDYFVGARPRPLAPINTNVSVNNNMVSVIDVTQKIQAQRFANSIMRARSKIENYVEDLFGRRPAPDFHNPFFLTRQAEIIYGDEVQNTADAQVTSPNSRTSLFKSNNGQFLFTFHNDDAHPCTYIQIVSFDVKRAYTKSIDRSFMHLDRYDMFNPDFQYIGDQPVYGMELGYTFEDFSTIPAVFGYQGRDMEYKQRFDVASGGFVENLPGWCLTDQARTTMRNGRIDSDFIRSFNTELDPFFLALDGYSLGSYFHFILIAINNVSAKRAMAVDPQILE